MAQENNVTPGETTQIPDGQNQLPFYDDIDRELPPINVVSHAGQHDDPSVRELPVRDFDKTSIRGAMFNDHVKAEDIPDHPVEVIQSLEAQLQAKPDTSEPQPPLTTLVGQEKNPRKWKKRLGGAIAAVSFVGIGTALALSDKSSDEPVQSLPPAEEAVSPETQEEKDPASVPTPNNEEAPIDSSEGTPTSSETPTDNQTETPEVVNDEYYGNINLTNLPLGQNYITATRPNGETIEVPYLSGDTTLELANSALALLSCYLSTGSEECLEAFTNEPETQTVLRGMWDELEPTYHVEESPKYIDSQFAIIDSPEDPAIFTETDDPRGYRSVELTGGTLYGADIYNNFGSNEWQHSDIHRLGVLHTKFQTLRLLFGQVGDQSLTVAGMEYKFVRTESN